MSTSIPSSAPSAERRPTAWSPDLDGGIAWIAIVALSITVAIVVARLSPPAFAIAAAAVLVAVGFAAWRWPLATLVGATLATLADPEITPRILPSGVDTGPIGISEPMLAVAGAVIAVEALRRGTFIRAVRDPVTALLGLFVALGLVSAVVNATPPLVAALGLLMTLDAIAIYFVARMVPADDRQRGIAVGAIVAVVVAIALFGIAQVLLDPDLFGFFSKEGQFGEGYRISSIIGNANMVAAVIGLTIPFALFGSRHLVDPRLRWAARAALVILAWAMLLTFSRGAWASIGIATVVGTLLLDWRSLPILVVALVLAWGAATVMPRGLLVPEAAGGDGGGSGGGAPSIIGSTEERIGNLADRNDTRARFLRDGLRVVDDNFWLGVGPGRYGGAAAKITESPVYEEYDVELFGYRTVHNFWLHLLGESGVLGTVVFLTLIAGLLIRFVRAAWRSEGLRFVILAGTATMLLVASLHSVTEMIFEGNMPVLIVWLVVGIASVLAPVQPVFGPRSSEAEVPQESGRA
jgi:O-antigen ligase